MRNVGDLVFDLHKPHLPKREAVDEFIQTLIDFAEHRDGKCSDICIGN